MIRVLVADDHAILRSGLRLLLEQEAGMELAGEAANGEEVLAWMQHGQADIVVMDVGMPLLNGIETTAILTRKFPRTGIVMLSMHSDETYILRCLRAGARGYVLKEAAEHELIAAIQAVAAGRSFFSPKVRRLLEHEDVERIRRAGGSDRYELLTGREREVLQLVAEGSANKEVAAKLHLSVHTVETHRKNIAAKVNVHGTADLILYAVRKGLAV
ncbi:MAG TPA: response regulator transcription factor [Candidatus Sulfopaludibacter sp.]|jgi:DNA-binding NarL/FixJ family response regulator|nr:response regulator transcription factor [Candidatus Sulfopaludibacter sp.]